MWLLMLWVLITILLSTLYTFTYFILFISLLTSSRLIEIFYCLISFISSCICIDIKYCFIGISVVILVITICTLDLSNCNITHFVDNAKFLEHCNIFLTYKPLLLCISFYYLFMAVLGLCCGTWTFSGWGDQSYSLVAMCRLLTAVASLIAGLGLESIGSLVVVNGFSWHVACGILVLCTGRHTLNQWTTREVPVIVYFKYVCVGV